MSFARRSGAARPQDDARRIAWAILTLTILAGCEGTLSSPARPGGGGPSPWPTDETTQGRIPRRMSADQVRAVLRELTGHAYLDRATVRDPDSIYGVSTRDDADILDVYAQALGRPDYNYTVQESLDPSVSYAKLVGDAARATCGAAASEEITQGTPPGGAPRLLLRASARDVLPTDEAAIRDNVVALVERFWGHSLATDHPDVDGLVEVFRVASTPERGEPTDVAAGWRAVCVALATDPELTVY